jgi:preprotein translocase subunit SecA
VSDLALAGAAPPRLKLPSQRLYAEAPERRETPLEGLLVTAESHVIAAAGRRRARRLRRILPLVDARASDLRALATDALTEAARQVAMELRRTPDFPDAAVARAFAVIRELSDRLLGQRHYDVQVLGAFGMIKGMLTEMATGEGKTLTATLVAGVAGLAGVPIHVVTVNDYLARRDAEWMTPLYGGLGLTVGIVESGQSAEERRAAYACDITYCTNKELAFDYLRDRMVLGQTMGDLPLKVERLHRPRPRSEQLRLRGLHFALVDEADSVLVDEARTPLIISGAMDNPVDTATVAAALSLAKNLEKDADFFVASEERRIHLTEPGQKRVTAFAADRGGHWRSSVSREELARQALSALHLFDRDKHYVIVDGKVQIVDEYTGRIMPDRSWSDGLHQMIEHKEGCDLTARHNTLARITYQRFFRRYRRLAGMSGTLQPVAAELWRVYRLKVVRVPTARPVQRIHRPDIVVPTEGEKWWVIVGRVKDLHDKGVPVLIGTRSVASSERASTELSGAGLPHAVLNATQDRREAEIVAEAGEKGRITVATNMAGRGTDIHLGEGIEELGGLHVIMTERHDARRIDLQLAGRAGRQGQRGSFEAILSLEDPLMDTETGVALSGIAKFAARYLGRWIGREAANYAQRRAERLHARMRADLLRSDEWQTKTLAFSGRPE